ncbi:MAG: MFS transporter [Methylovirgula sp.]
MDDIHEHRHEHRTDWIARGTDAYRNMNVAFFFAGYAIFSLLYCVQPLLPIFAEDFHISPAESSLSLSLSTALLALAILAAAALSEGLGRRGLMFVSIAVASVLNIAAAAAPNWPLMVAIRALEGIALGGAPAIAMTYLAEEIHPRGLGFAMGLYVGGTAFGGMCGRMVTGILAELTSWRGAMIGIGAAGLVSAIVFLVLLPRSRNFKRRHGFDVGYHLRAWARHLGSPCLQLLFAIGFLEMGAFVCLYNYAGFRLTAPPFSLTQTELGLIFIVYLFGVAASWKAGALADRIGRRVVLPIGVVVTAAGVGITMLPGLIAMILGISLLTIGFFGTHAVASGWVGRLAGEAKGHASSLYLLFYYIGSSVIGSAGGWFWAETGWTGVAGFTLAALALALVAALRLRALVDSE